MAERTRVMVAGAGLAGLATALWLTRRGFDVVVCERGETAGGRLAPLPAEGAFQIDRAWPVLCGADRELGALADELGVSAELMPLRPLKRGVLHRGRICPVDPRSWIGVARIPGIPPQQALRLRRLPRLLARYAACTDAESPGRAAPLDDRSLGDFARLYFGPALLERWMAPLLDAESPIDPEQTSRALFLRRYRRQRGARHGLPRAPLAELCEAAAKRLKLLTGSEIVRVERPARGPLQVALGPQGRIHEAEAVVVATSAGEAARLAEPLLATAEREFLMSTRYAATLDLVVGLRRPLSPHPQLVSVPGDAGLPLLELLFEPGVAGGRVPPGHGLATLRTRPGWAARHRGASDESVTEALLDAFAAVDPRVRGAVLFSRVLREPRGFARFDVGRYRALSRFEDLQSEMRRSGRHLYFAGDYLMDPSWAGALASARRVVEELAEDLSASR